jgi:PAS domain S-box-containing protein
MGKKREQAGMPGNKIEGTSGGGGSIDLPFDQLAPGWLAAIVESADDAIVSKTLQGIITSWNPAAQRIFGYTPEEAVGQSVLLLIPEHLHPEEETIISNIRAGRRVDHYETVRRRKDGSLIDVSLTISPIKAPDGTIVGASKIARDVTARKQADRRLEEQTEVVETINRVGRMLSAELDQQKLIQGVTDAATELTGAEFGAFFYNVDDGSDGSYMLYTLSGVPRSAFENFPMPRATDLFGPTFRGEGTIRIDDVKADARYGNNPPYHGMPQGHLPVTSYLAVTVVSRFGDVIGGLFFGHSQPGVFQERHERIVEGLAAQTAVAIDNARLYQRSQDALREREELLRREKLAREQAEVASRSKDEFLSLLSHELRTPLNAILGWSRMLTTSQLEPEPAKEALSAIERNARLQSRLIDDMLDVSRILAGKLRLDAQPTDLTAAINAAVDTLRPAADAKKIRLYVVLDYGSGTVLGDPVRLQQIVWNLLSNAIKFTPKLGSVRVTLARIDSHFEITVSDTGRGIEDKILPFIFDRFRQGDSSTTKEFGGLGLGLSIVRQLVELHGGSVHAGNLAEGGAIFRVVLPVAATHLPREADGEAEYAGAAFEGLAIEPPAGLQGVRILVVDDDEDSRNLLATILSKGGATVETVGSAHAALAAFHTGRPDVLISDIGMPGEDGYSLIRKVRGVDGGRRVPAIALTAFARSEDRIRALSAGFNMHVPKPVEPTELLMVISSLLHRT